ncbi:class I SAM-dependent methyltransferase [Alteribacillus sp. HJP-4]|uniref:class I SAM-dependent methyltransferase n=1 Tax=Alteribacillus sp. HJP-4 TaxID=2775394 RepID=UPI0035CCE817
MKNFNPEEMKQMFEKKVANLENPQKRMGLTPESLLDILPLQGEESILDLGAGTGYFTFPIAQKTIGPVYSLDIDDNMLEFLKKRITEKNSRNVHPVKGSMENIPLPASSVDVVVASLVLHEANQLNAVLNEINHVLKPGGMLVCIELEKEENAQHNHPRIELSEMKNEIANAKLQVKQAIKPSKETYIITAEK